MLSITVHTNSVVRSRRNDLPGRRATCVVVGKTSDLVHHSQHTPHRGPPCGPSRRRNSWCDPSFKVEPAFRAATATALHLTCWRGQRYPLERPSRPTACRHALDPPARADSALFKPSSCNPHTGDLMLGILGRGNGAACVCCWSCVCSWSCVCCWSVDDGSAHWECALAGAFSPGTPSSTRHSITHVYSPAAELSAHSPGASRPRHSLHRMPPRGPGPPMRDTGASMSSNSASWGTRLLFHLQRGITQAGQVPTVQCRVCVVSTGSRSGAAPTPLHRLAIECICCAATFTGHLTAAYQPSSGGRNRAEEEAVSACTALLATSGCYLTWRPPSRAPCPLLENMLAQQRVGTFDTG